MLTPARRNISCGGLHLTEYASAVETANRLAQRVILIDGGRLSELMIEYGVGVRTTRLIEIKRLDEDFFEEAD
jgi:restriction system protein